MPAAQIARSGAASKGHAIDHAAMQIGGSARGYLELFARIGNPDHGGADSGEAVFLCIAADLDNDRFCRWERSQIWRGR
jgi:hypothetical protein